MKPMKIHIRRIGLLTLNILVGHALGYWLIGCFNKYVFNRPIKSVFLLYPANRRYTEAYSYSWIARRKQWSPFICGFYRLGNRYGLIFGISAVERDFQSDHRGENLEKIECRMEAIRRLVGADQKSFSGILPGLMFARGVIDRSLEREVTVEALIRALHQVAEEQDPVIVLGGRGFIGSRMIKRLAGREVYSVDIKPGDGNGLWPKHLRGKRAVVVNVSRKAALSYYLTHFWPELIFLNEVYPEPNAKEVETMSRRGVSAYHVVGVKGKAWPGFPRAYQGGIPCCGAWLSEDMEILVRKLNGKGGSDV